MELTEDGKPADPTDWYGLDVRLSAMTMGVLLNDRRDGTDVHVELFRAR